MRLNDSNSNRNWLSQLQKVTSSRTEAQGKNTQHCYLAIKAGDIQVFEDLQKLAGTGYRKMKLSEIVSASKIALKNNYDATISTNICKAVEQITQAKQAKMNTPGKKCGRFLLSALKIISYISLIGIPLGLVIRLTESIYFTSHQKEISEAKAFYDITLAPEVLQKLQHKWNLVLDNLNSIDTEILRNDLVKQIDIDVKVKSEHEMLQQFWLDYKREGVDYRIHDRDMITKSDMLEHDKSEERAKHEYKKITDILSNDSQKWIDLIQSVLTQTSSSGASADLIGSLADLDPHKIRIKLTGNAQIAVDIIRNKSGFIEKLQLKVHNTAGLFHTNDFAYELQGLDRYQVAKKIAEVNTLLTYDVGYDSNYKLHVENVKIKHQLSVAARK